VISKIVSGGQTGADRAALDFAIENGIPHGGWCPKGRKASDGVLDSRYLLTETPSAGYSQRTHWNVRDSDGTLVVNMGELSGGTLLTTKVTAKARKPCLVVQAVASDAEQVVGQIRSWVDQENIRTLNVAGPREEKAPGIYAVTKALLSTLLRSK
jgi:predicted Rossmann fold nucleotide-binding protein DprA/Smf involved in DNA uptake